jgi:two-component system response regulator AtoC
MSGERSVLVVDDELGMRETLAEILTQSGYRVSEAADGEAALEAIRVQRFDAVLMDIRMPGRDGIAVLREVGAPPPPVILMTAYAHAEQVREAERAHAFALVGKPFQVRALLGLIASAAGAAA